MFYHCPLTVFDRETDCLKLLADAAVLKIMNKFDFWSAVPLDGSASYDEIAERTNLPIDAVRRILASISFLFLWG